MFFFCSVGLCLDSSGSITYDRRENGQHGVADSTPQEGALRVPQNPKPCSPEPETPLSPFGPRRQRLLPECLEQCGGSRPSRRRFFFRVYRVSGVGLGFRVWVVSV